jgi:hypothetical protein
MLRLISRISNKKKRRETHPGLTIHRDTPTNSSKAQQQISFLADKRFARYRLSEKKPTDCRRRSLNIQILSRGATGAANCIRRI